MIFKQKTLLIVILLSVVVIFAVLGAMKHSAMTVEGMTTETDSTKEDVPLCSNSNVPGCYSTVMDPSIWDGTEELGDEYILKTEIVPPVCPACPSVINQHAHDGEVTGEGEKLAGSEYEESNVTNITNQENIINQNIKNVDSTVAEVGAAEEVSSLNEQANQQQTQQAQQGTLQTATSGQDTVTETMLSSYEKTINDF